MSTNPRFRKVSVEGIKYVPPNRGLSRLTFRVGFSLGKRSIPDYIKVSYLEFNVSEQKLKEYLSPVFVHSPMMRPL